MTTFVRYPFHIQKQEYHILTKHTIKNPTFFDRVRKSNDYITNHKKIYYLFLIKGDFKVVFNFEFSLHVETHFYHNTMLINLKRYLIDRIGDFIE